MHNKYICTYVHVCMLVIGTLTYVCGVASRFGMFVYSCLDLGSCLDEEEVASRALLSAFGQPSHPSDPAIAERSGSLLFSVCCVYVYLCVRVEPGRMGVTILIRTYMYVCTYILCTCVYVCDCEAGYTLYTYAVLECVHTYVGSLFYGYR